MGKTKIQWAEHTWNFAIGCRKVDTDCKVCYMYRNSFDNTRYDPKAVKRTKTTFNAPLKLKEPTIIFTCSLSDFFIEEIDSFRDEAWDIIRRCPQHTFQILTKRPHRIREHLPKDWNENFHHVWIGTSVGGMQGIHRLHQLVDAFEGIRKPIKFISFEPLHEHIVLNFEDAWFKQFDWVIIGGESGNETGKYKYRPCELSWIEELGTAFAKRDVPVFIKQMGTHLAKQMGMKDKHGGNIEEFPLHLQVRDFPKEEGYLIEADIEEDTMLPITCPKCGYKVGDLEVKKDFEKDFTSVTKLTCVCGEPLTITISA